MRTFLTSNWGRVPAILSIALALPLAGCIAHAPGSGGGSGGTTKVSISPTSASVSGGSTTNFTATVTGPNITAVTWNVNGTPNGNSTIGTIAQGSCGNTSCAVYTAPPTVPNPNTVSITAVATADGTTSAPASVTITPSTVALSVTPPLATLDAGQTATFTATVTGTSNLAVGWYVAGVLNGNSSVGTISAQSTSTGSIATYTAPGGLSAPLNNPNNVQITATSAADTFVSANATASVLPIVVTVAPAATVQIPVSGTQTFTATVAGATDATVTNWQVNGIVGGNSTIGTILSTGTNTALYTAPPTVSAAPFPLTISAVSNADANSVGSTLGNVHVIVTVTPATDTIGQGANLQMTATVTGAPSGGTGVDWSVACAACTGQQTAGIVDPLNPGLYIAPGLQQLITTVQAAVSATSTFDPQQVGTATLTVLKNDPLGTVTPSTAAAATINCPNSLGGVGGATCYQLNVSCDAIASWNVYLKVNQPTATPYGTVILGTGSGGTTLYDNDPSFVSGSFNGGQTLVNDLLNPVAPKNPYTTVQISFGAPFDTSSDVANGWLQGPGGVRRLACRYASVADWVYKNIHNSNTAAPYCATGNSGGSGAIGYAVSEYNLASEFSHIELTSGPVMTLLNQGCNLCSQYSGADPCPGAQPEPMCYTASGGTGSTAAIIDTAYQAVGQTTPTLCTNGVNGDNSNFSRFLSDSIEDDPGISPALPIAYPPTTVIVLFGATDPSNAVPQGFAWRNAVGPTPPLPICVANTPHAVPSTAAGEAQIESDIQTNCTIH